jgi:hypothetical protein
MSKNRIGIVVPNHGNRLRTVTPFHFFEFVGYQLEGLVPGDSLESTLTPGTHPPRLIG